MPQVPREKPLRKQILLAMRLNPVPAIHNSMQQVQNHRTFDEILRKLRLSTREIKTKRKMEDIRG
jgi:hypothetical protein